jgi:PAS domain S-box-containing protein
MRNKPRKSNENNFMTLLNFIVDPAVIVDEKGKFRVVNGAFIDLTGLSKKELIGTAFLDMSLLTAESKAILLKNLMKRMQGLPVEPYEISFTDKTGKVRYVEIKAKKIDYAGHPADLVIFRDITRRKENARRLKEYSEKMEALVNEKVKEVKESEERYRELTESINDIFFAMDKNLRYTFWNKASEKLTGISAKDAIGKHLTEIFPAIKGTRVEQFYKKVLRTKQSQRFLNKYRVRDKDFVFEISAYPTMAGLAVFVKDITERKKSETKLLASEKKYRKLFENLKLAEKQLLEERDRAQNYLDVASVMFVALDTKGRITMLNRKGCEILKCTVEEALGKNWFDNFLPNKVKNGVKRHFRSILAGKASFPKYHENPVLAKNGDIRLIWWHNTVLRNRDGRVVGTLSSGEDITEWKQAQQALVDSEEKFRNLAEQSPNMVFVNKKGRVVYANKKAEEIMGYSKEEFYSPSFIFLCLIAPESREQIKTIYGRHVKNGKDVGPFEYKLVTKNGRILDAILTSRLVTYEGDKAIIGTVIDITEHKKMEDELKQERDMLEAVTENVGAGLAIISEDYHILWANKLLKQINGDCEGKMCYSTFNRLTDICPDCGVKKVFENGTPLDIHEYSNKDDKGNTFWVELIVTPIKDEKGNIIAALELAVNITERKIMQNKLAEYSQKLEKIVEKRTEQLKQTQAKLVKSERLATIGELAAMVGHDLRNPLTGIMGAAYYLKAKHGTDVGAKGKEMLETIENAIKYSNKIINDLLEYSRDLKLEFTETTPKAMLQSALSLLEVPEKIQIIDATKDKPTVKADTEKIRKGFVNIIQNAIDAMPEGGTLTIKSRKVKSKLEIAFKDTGTGMSEEALSKLKGGVPLFTTKSKGMGFGLPICRRLVEAHGGKISVKSMAGKGTTVTVTIPVNPEPVNEREEKWIFSESMLSAIIATHRAR